MFILYYILGHGSQTVQVVKYRMKGFVVYILRTSKNTLYTGQTNDLEQRLKKHRLGKGAKYVRSFDSFELVYCEYFSTRSEAMKREIEIKGWSKIQKEELVKLWRLG